MLRPVPMKMSFRDCFSVAVVLAVVLLHDIQGRFELGCSGYGLVYMF